MAVSLDTTVSGATSNAYLSEADADTYFESKVNFDSVWDGLDSTEKIQRIIEATRGIDTFSFNSSQVDYSSPQALAFPRANQLDITIIPTEVKNATCEMLMYQYHNADSTSDQIDREILAVSVPGPISVTFGDKVGSSTNSVFGANLDRVRSLLRDYLDGGNSSVSINIVK